MPAGRPTKFTPERGERVVQYMRMAAFLETAAAQAGLATNTVKNWLREAARVEEDLEKSGRKGTKKERDLVEFLMAYNQACSHAELVIVGVAFQGAQNDAKTAMDWLKLRYPERYTERRVNEHQGEVRHTHGYANKLKGDEKAQRAADLLARRVFGGEAEADGDDLFGDEPSVHETEVDS